MGVAGTVLVVVGVLLVGGLLVVWWGNRMVRNPGPEATSMGDGFGGLIEAFNPGHARAREELERQERQGPVTPTPDDDDREPVRFERNPDGSLRKVRIRRPDA